MYRRTLFIFRRDLRLEDNTGLIYSLSKSKEVIPCFIFTPEQIRSNPYLGDHSLQFLVESLEDLTVQLQSKKSTLYLFYGEPEKIVENCIQTLGIDAVVVNRDYTPYSVRRDESIRELCVKEKIGFHSFDDALLQPPEATVKKDGTPYTIFTPFYRNVSDIPVKCPAKNMHENYFRAMIKDAIEPAFYQDILPRRELATAGGRSKALNILRNFQSFTDYEMLKDFPAYSKTTCLSAHLKFTTCSPREVYYALLQYPGSSSSILRSLYWRDFFSSIAFFFPHVFGNPFRRKYDDIKWCYDREAFSKWCAGNTGFPIVDAGMRELNQTGYMSNRLRMITASFLVKDLQIDWRLGERYFAQKLSDYDPAINNGNWQWIAGTGCDAQPYFRVFNPWSQAKTYDPDCVYIKRFIPELVGISSKIIHDCNRRLIDCSSYPPPMLNHSEEAKKSKTMYEEIRS